MTVVHTSPIQTGSSSLATFPSIVMTGAKYNSTSSVIVHALACSSHDGSVVMSTSSDTTISTASTGLNGIAESSNLTGTISVTASTDTVTGSGTSFTTDYVAGDVIQTNGGQKRVVESITNDTSLVVTSNWSSTESGAAYKRGGLAADCLYTVYVISNGSTTGCILSTRTVRVRDGGTATTLVDLPSGYTIYRQLPYDVWTDSSSNVRAHVYDSKTIYYSSISLGSLNTGTITLIGASTAAEYRTYASGILGITSCVKQAADSGTVFTRRFGTVYTGGLAGSGGDCSEVFDFVPKANDGSMVISNLSGSATYSFYLNSRHLWDGI